MRLNEAMKMIETTATLPIADPAFEDWLRQIVADAVSDAVSDAVVDAKKDETVLLNEKEAAEFFGLRPQTLALWRHQSKGPPYIKLGSSVRYDFKELRAFSHSQRVGQEVER